MLRAFLNLYRIPLVLSLTLAVILVSFTVETRLLQIVLITAGSILGAFILDLDYVLHAYFLEPEADFSRTLKTYIEHRDFKSAINFVITHKGDVTEKTLNSGLFQVVLIALLFFVIYSDVNVGLKAFLLAIYLNSIYKFVENYYIHKSFDDWFWFMQASPKKEVVALCVIALLSFFLYFIFYF